MTSIPPSPISGFDDDGNPVSADVRSPQRSVTRRESGLTGKELLGPLPPVTRVPKKSVSGRFRSSSLPSVPEDRKLNQFTFPPNNHDSIDSLAWDGFSGGSEYFTGNDSRASVSTQFSVPLTGNSTQDQERFVFSSSSSDEFLDVAENDVNINPGLNLDFLEDDVISLEPEKSKKVNPVKSINHTSHTGVSESNELELTLKMSETVKKHRGQLARVRMIYEDDIETLNPDEVTFEFLAEKVKIAEELKTLSQTAILYLSENDDQFNPEELQGSSDIKRSLLDFIKLGQKYLRNAANAPPKNTETEAAGDPVKAATRRIKTDRVIVYEQKTVDDLQSMIDELKVLLVTEPESDSDFRSLAERFSGVNKRTETVLKGAMQLYNDAVETGLEAQAKKIETSIRELQDTHLETETKIQSHKASFGLLGVSDSTKIGDVEIPTFSGDHGDKFDYYSFKDEYEQYLKTKSYSKSDQLRVLQRSALKGAAKAACLDFTDINEVWDYLKNTYGNVRILLANKIMELKKLGPCQGNDLKKREWCLNIKAKLRYLHNLALKHNVAEELYFSPVILEVQAALPQKLQDDFREKFRDEEKNGIISRKVIFTEFLDYLDELILNFTSDINFEMTSLNLNKLDGQTSKHAPTSKPPFKPHQQKKAFANMKKDGKQTPGPQNKSKRQVLAQGTPSKAQERDCPLCNSKHTHLQYCEEFQKAQGKLRYQLTGRVKACFRCLRMDAEVDFNNREVWWERHKSNCNVSWECKQGRCGTKSPFKQYHLLLCLWHANENKQLEEEYIKSLNQSLLKPGVKFFFNYPYNYSVEPVQVPVPKKMDGYSILPDVDNPAIFMLQSVRVDKDKILLLFYDSGCMGASLSSRAVSMMETTTVRPGPTFMSVAGAETIRLETGDERFWLLLADGATKATLTGLQMPNITTPFPAWDLQEAWQELQKGYAEEHPKGEPLPQVSTSIGGCAVDIMVGIRYHSYFPTLMYTLPCGLGVYKSKFASDSGHLGILGGPHRTWRNARDSSHMLGPRAYFTAEARAYFMEGFLLRKTMNFISSQSEDQEPNIEIEDHEPELADKCTHQHCSKHLNESGWMVPMTWSLDGTRYVFRDNSPKFSEIEALGAETSYRCIRCRNCNDCRKGEVLERVSLQEEAEQALIENCVTLNPRERRLEARLPFIQDPLISLTPNQGIAEKILESQLRLVARNPEMKADTISSHNKLRDKGHVIPYSDLTSDERTKMDSTVGSGYTIPWRTVYKENSLSTPCRMVFDASSRTPGGESLNTVLAKGQNKLAKLLNILLRFRSKQSAMTADVSMAYNGVKLSAEHYRYQRYLWKEDLNPSNPIVVMIIRTLIYGVKPSGNLTMAAFEKLAEYCKLHHPEHLRGAVVLSEDAYMDDILHSEDSPEDCQAVATSLDFTLNLGSMSVKEYTFSGSVPSEKVSADGKTVGLVGMLWDPVNDTISLDIKELYLGKPRRGKLPATVQGDIGTALKDVFTRRVTVGKVNGVFDPLGLATPITARFKLNLHELCKLNLDWDDRIPDDYLHVWVKNLQDIQGLREIKFRRPVIPPDAANTNVEFITSVDASATIAIAVVHSRVQLITGKYHVQLVCAKSKLVSTSTVPRAEMKAATMGAVLTHTAKVNFNDQYTKSIFVTDSTVVLYWINQDQRPLHVAVRNAVIEVRRFTQTEQWFHIETHLNIADLGTRNAELADIKPGSEWQEGKSWMEMKQEEMPIRTLAEITLTSEERRAASQEQKAPDIAGIVLSNLITKVGDRYAYSKYIVDPCVMAWPKSVRILAYVFRFLQRIAPNHTKYRRKIYGKPSCGNQLEQVETPGEPEPRTQLEQAETSGEPETRTPEKVEIPGETETRTPEMVEAPGEPETRTPQMAETPEEPETKLPEQLETKPQEDLQLSEDEIEFAERYFFLKATSEVKQFSKDREWKECSIEKNGILYYSSRILDGQEIVNVENSMLDLEPLSFVKPMIDRYSPVAYSIMGHTHTSVVKHRNAVTTLRESRNIAFILQGRSLANEIRDSCVFCRRFKAKLLEVEMGKLHENRLTIAPAFYQVQVDLLGPFTAVCEHNHRSTVPVYGAVFKDPATAAIAVHTMQSYNTAAFLQAYTRFSSRFGHPSRMYIDEGSQLMKACRSMEINLVDLTHSLNSQYQVGIKYQTCPVGGHNAHGIVERSIREVKKLFNLLYSGLRLDILTYETAFLSISNELNNLPICLGSRTSNLDHVDLITPSRLILGRNNRRALGGHARIQGPSRLMKQMEQVYEAWWKVWQNERLVDYIPQPRQWTETRGEIKVGDVVIFLKTDKEQSLGDPVWKMGRIKELEISNDGLARTAIVEYKNATESVFRTTRRSVRKIAVLHREGDLELVQELNEASRRAGVHFMQQQSHKP